MAGKDKLEFDVLANDKASTKFDKIANSAKALGKGVKTGVEAGSNALKKLQKGAKETGESLGKLGDKGKEGLGKLAEGMKAGPLAWVGLGAGLGALVIEGFQGAMEKQDADALLGAQLGASDAQMKKLGTISGDMYKNAFGESVAEVDDVLKTVFQSGLATLNDSEDKIKGVTEQVMNYSKITGEEALPVTRAISQMLKTGLAKNATEAFDLLTKGTQKGLDKSEDLLDTVNEYGTQFRKVGLTGQQAFGLISQAIQAGARDSDIAADAIKEFSIRAIDGSDLTAQSFKGLGLSAKTMSSTIAEGGPKAAAALGLTLDKLRAVKDPTKQAALAVGLFGTQAEDLGQALYAMDLDTAAGQFGTVAGAAKRAGDIINDTASNKLATIGRTIKMSIVDAIGKYALPKLEEFADWFNGPGKMVMVGWALTSASAVVGFADKTIGALQAVIPALSKFAAVSLLAAAGAVAVFNPNLAVDMVKQAKGMDDWGKSAEKSLGKAREGLAGWQSTLDKAQTKVKLEADIESLEQDIATAQKELRDPGLTKTRRASLQADIAQLTRQKDAAIRKLNDPGLIKTRVAQLTANKQSLDTKLAAARRALADPKLTATKTAQLKATIAQLLRQKANAQAAINSLTGRTVVISASVRVNAANIRAKVDAQLARLGLVEGRETGGKVYKGQAYVVGEKRPELFVPKQDGEIVPTVPSAAGSPRAYRGGGGGGGGAFTLSFNDTETSRFIVKMLRKGLNDGGVEGNVQMLIGGRPA
jgi:hypothetical protein